MSLEDDLLEQRVRRVGEIEALGFRAYGQRFDFTHTVPEILAKYNARTAEELDAEKPRVKIAGRIQTVRRMGKAGFMHLAQLGERLQVYVRKDAVSEREYALYNLTGPWVTSSAPKAIYFALARESSACTWKL